MSRWMVLALLVACGSAPAEGPAPSAAPAVAGTTHVLITAEGYTPDRVVARPGQDLTLVFERLDEFNCGEELVIPSTGAKYDIPVGKKVEVKLTAPESGELAFTCGMAMYEGAVVVSGG